MSRPPPAPVVIRPATAADAVACAAGARQVAETPRGIVSRPHEIRDNAVRDHIEALADGARGAYLVAVLDGAVVGHAWLERYGPEVTAHVAHLSLVVHEGFQGRGIGRALFEAVVDRARAHPAIEKLELRVRATNARARALYASVGFVDEGVFRRRIKLGDTYLDDVSMALWVDG
ncbi:MAG: GNAT family N-acetyltransferase [Alphaproteobacteria bacterium]|nr:GNAT family N-acetyltransferase [Alphaproteobacteria bacterium]